MDAYVWFAKNILIFNFAVFLYAIRWKLNVIWLKIFFTCFIIWIIICLWEPYRKEGGGYQVPEIEIVDVKVEAGFAVSTETGESASGGWGMTDDSGDGEWE